MATETDMVQTLKDVDDVFDRFVSALTQYGISQLGASALTLQLFGGVEQRHRGRDVRGTIHGAYTVDTTVNIPGLVDHLTALSPAGDRVNATNATYTGFTGTVRSKGPNAGWFLDTGVLTDTATDYLAIQSPHALDDKTVDGLIEATGAGGITVTKKGFHDTVPVNAAVLLIGHPLYEDWDEYEPLVEQVYTFGGGLASNLDFVFADVNGLQSRMNTPPVEREAAAEYIQHAQETCTPSVPNSVDNKLFEAATEIHIEGMEEDGVPQAAHDSLRRLAEAAARVRLSDNVTMDDAELAITIYRRPYEVLHGIDNKAMNLSDEKKDVAIQGRVSEETKKKRRLRQIFAEMDQAIDEDELLERAQDEGLTEREALLFLGELKGQSEIGQSRDGNWYDYNF